jgi:hypothetical protein
VIAVIKAGDTIRFCYEQRLNSVVVDAKLKLKEVVMSIPDVVETNRVRKRITVRKILLLLAVLSSPLGCCGCVFLLNVLPPALLPPMMNLFETEARIENRSGETLYLTPITTTRGRPEVITQLAFLRQRDIPLQPGRSIVLTYDAADMPLSGIAVCRTNDDCRLLAVDYSNAYYLDSFEDLPGLEPGWLLAIRSLSPYNFSIVLFPVLGLVPVVLFLSWLYLGKLEKKVGKE